LIELLVCGQSRELRDIVNSCGRELVEQASILKPVEISLAHHGVRFLDELAEFRREVLKLMREPLEDGSVTISRTTIKVPSPIPLTSVPPSRLEQRRASAPVCNCYMHGCPCGH
jgi:predicted ATPase with chaperone activity